MLGRARPATADLAVAVGFLLAAAAEAVVLHRHTPGLLAFSVAGAPLLTVLAVRRRRPLVPMCVITAFAVLGTTAQTVFWRDAPDSGGVWMFALMFASFSLGAHGRGRVVAKGGVLPMLVVLAADLPTMSGWALVNGVIFVTTFVGLLPTAVGRVIKVRRDRLAALERQRDEIVREQQARRESTVLAERLRTSERLQPALLDGLRALAERAETGADPGEIEQAARQLLGRTREEVVALTAPVDVPAAEPVPPVVDHLGLLRAAAQRWAVLGAGATGTALALESTRALPLTAPGWAAVAGSLAVAVPLALVWWRPLAAEAVAWVAMAAFSRLIAPLDGTLSGSAMALGAAFAVGALSTRRWAIAGLVLCWVGQTVGVGAADPLGEAVIILICWSGGLALNEVSRLVEQGRANNQLLSGQEAVARQRAVVEERLRVAREVHDQLGHSLTVVALQAGAARRMATADPRRTQQVLATIATAARDGLAAMAGDAATDLAGLLQRTRSAGLDVAAEVGDLRWLHPDQRALCLRVVQEALTNVLRHAPGARTTVVVRPDDSVVTVAVCNGPPARPRGEPGTGQGLVGLRERVTAAAGELHWGPREDGGFDVSARLPARHLEAAR